MMINQTWDAIVQDQLNRKPIVTVKVKTTGYPSLILQHPSEQVLTLLLHEWRNIEVEKYIEENNLLIALTSDNPYKEAYQLLDYLQADINIPTRLKFKIVKPPPGSLLWFKSKLSIVSFRFNIGVLVFNVIAWLVTQQLVILFYCLAPAIPILVLLTTKNNKRFI